MARIRTIKPEFWEDDVIGSLSRDARLLFIATLNLADDEGLLRWSAAYLKASAFMYDDDISIKAVEKLMAELIAPGLLFEYRAGKSQQPFAYVVNFHKHQRINRPTPSKFVPPSIQNRAVREMYARRDGWICHLCGGRIDQTSHESKPDFELSMDHVTPVSHGGEDFPSNIRASHVTCNKGRGDKSVEEYKEILRNGSSAAHVRHRESFNERLTEEVIEATHEPLSLGREGKGNRKEGKGERASAPRPRGKQFLPSDYSLTETLLVKAKAALRLAGKQDVNYQAEFVRFCEHFWSPDSRNRAKSDWDRAFVNWCLSEYSKPSAEQGVLGPQGDPQDVQWRSRLRNYKSGGYWPDVWGSRPGEPGCVAPRHLLQELGINAEPHP